MFLQLRYNIQRFRIAFFEKSVMTPLGRWKRIQEPFYAHYGNIDNDVGIYTKNFKKNNFHFRKMKYISSI